MRYGQALGYLESFVDYEKIGYRDKKAFSLHRIKHLAQIFDNPQKSFPSIHITGTKGKGSTAIFTARILEEAGYRTGLYVSPHMYDPRERMSVNGRLIDKNHFALLAEKLKNKLSKAKIDFKPTYFEAMTILALNYFRAASIDYGVIEVGLGGSLDATNIVNTLVSMVTPISRDHTQILGSSIKKIASAKAGIIKKSKSVVSSPQCEEALSVLRSTSKKMNSGFFLVGKDITFKERRHDSRYEVFDIKGRLKTYENCRIALVGRHQIENACAAVAACEVLTENGAKITPRHMQKGLEKARYPCRCEIINENPKIIIDGAQNENSARAIKETLKRNFKFKNMILVVGTSRDKDIKGICAELAPEADFIIATKSKHERAEDPAQIKSFIKNKPVEISFSVREAMDLALSRAGIDDLILVTGSFFVAGEARKVNLNAERVPV